MVRGSLELQNGGLRALEEASLTTFRLRHFLFDRYLYVLWGVQVAPRSVELRLRRSQELRGSLKLQSGGLRGLEEPG